MKYLVPWGLLATCPCLAFGTGVLDPIVVTATRNPTLSDEVSRTLTVIDAHELERRQYRTLGDALGAIPGLHTAPTGGAGQQTSVFVRGTESNHVLVLLNGVEIADPGTPSGTFEFAHLDMHDVERIEIVRGANSVLFGSDAIGGTVNIITKAGGYRPHRQLQFETGSFDTRNLALTGGGSILGARYRLGFNHQKTDGFSVTPARYRAGQPAEDDGHESLSLSGNLDAAVGNVGSVALTARHTDTRTEVDLGIGEDPDSVLKSSQLFAQARARRSWSDDLVTELSLGLTDHRRNTTNRADAFSATVQNIDYDARKVKLDVKADYLGLAEHLLSLGLSTEREHAQSDGVSDFGGFVIIDDMDARARTHALYAQDQFDFDNGLFGTIGIRLDYHNSFGRFFTYQIAPAYRLSSAGTTVRASLGRAFKAPALYELFGRQPNNFGGLYSGNPDLRPERGTAWDLGLQQDFASTRFGITYFRHQLHNLIETRFSFPDSTSVNVARARTQGAEVFLEHEIAPGFRTRIDYTYLEATSGDGLRLLRRPRHTVDLDVSLDVVPDLEISVRGRYVADAIDVSRLTGGRVHNADYAVFYLSADYRITRRLTGFARVDNVFDERYEPVDGFQAARRSAYIGIRYQPGD